MAIVSATLPLDNCVKLVLCGLSAAVRNAIVALIQGYLDQLQLAKTELQAKLIYLDLLTAPVNIAASLANVAIGEVQAMANIVPFSLIGDCFQIGALNEAVQSNIDLVLHDVKTVANDLNRLLSLRDEINENIAELEQVIDLYKAVISTIQVC